MERTTQTISLWQSHLNKAMDEILSWQEHSDELMNSKPVSNQWSVYEIIDHLDKVNRSYKAQLDNMVLGKGQPLRGLGLWWGKTLGGFILKSVKPDNPRKIKTFPVWEPSFSQLDASVIDTFKQSQRKLLDYLEKSSEGLANRIKITSPANQRIYYPLDLAYDIIVSHEQRHILQARQVFQQLKKG